MKQIDKETQLYSLFHEGFDRIPTKISDHLLATGTHELIMGIPFDDVSRILNGLVLTNGVGIPIKPIKLDRKVSEVFNHDAAQAIASVCIHDDHRVVLLQLTKDTIIDNYVKGTLTYPQGHCEWDKTLDTKLAFDSNSQGTERGTRIMSSMAFRDYIIENAFREATEELKINDHYGNFDFWAKVDEIMKRCRPSDICPIYIEKPGSMSRHICFLVDVAFPGNSLDPYIEMGITTNEPNKHNVLVVGYEGLLESVGRIDMICPWVAYSFRQIPFFKSTFIEHYLRKNP